MQGRRPTIAQAPVRRLLTGVIVCAAAFGFAGTAQGSFPGKPGQIVFSSTFTGDSEIFVAASDGSERTDVSRDPHADITPSWSADGRRIAFASNRAGSMDIYVMNADGSGVVQLTHDAAADGAPRFTADGRYVVYESNKSGNWEIRRVGTDGSNGVDLTRNRASDRFPATSPNGRLIAFSSNRGPHGTHIWVMSIDGNALRRVTVRRGAQFQPVWAPAGGRLAYVSGSLSSGTNIWTVLATGKRDHRLTISRAEQQLKPSWSPDGHSIVYQDCVLGSALCTLAVKSPGLSPVHISLLHTPFLDTFDGADSKLWIALPNDSGATNTEANGKLVTTLPANAVQSGPYNQIDASWRSNCQLVGDFDVQVDYQLLEWPPANGVQAMLSSFDTTNTPVFAMRESQTFGEQYSSWIPETFTSQPTSDLAGTLRVQRTGSTATVSYLGPANWEPIATGLTTTAQVALTLGASSTMNRFIHQEVKIAWDNLRINSGAMSCQDVSWRDESPDWQSAPTP